MRAHPALSILLCWEAASASLIRVRGTLIYEYIGEVVAEKTFRKRMQAYADEGIKHFYFMMLQKEEVGRVPMPHFTLPALLGFIRATRG